MKNGISFEEHALEIRSPIYNFITFSYHLMVGYCMPKMLCT